MSKRHFPAYPLIVHDPYFSVWSFSDNLNDEWAHHWTGSGYPIAGMVRIDGKNYNWMGCTYGAEKMPQVDRDVTPTATRYAFEASGVRLTVEFLTPALIEDLELLSRPVTYISIDAVSADGCSHQVAIYMDFCAELCVNEGIDPVQTARYSVGNLELLSLSAVNPKMLARVGDNMRIEWGRFYMAFESGQKIDSVAGIASFKGKGMRASFLKSGRLPSGDNLSDPSTLRHPCFAVGAAKAQEVSGSKTLNMKLMAAYDDVYSVEYLNQKLKAYWRRKGMSFSELLQRAWEERDEISMRCRKFDESLLAETTAAGGVDYSDLCTICYRQTIAAHKLVASVDGTPYFMSKENFSNGCICTVDVTYPSAPLYLWKQPALLKGMLCPIFDYVQTGRWHFPFAPHDLGTYPLANGQVYGGGEETEENQMPVEESGNMLILSAALLKFHGDVAFVKKYWKTIETWGEYLLEKGYDPENQLCTDDFAGHLAHNTNLSLKAIMALGGCSQMASAVGEEELAKIFMAAAKDAAARWQKDALDEKGCYRLAFDQPGTWSQKYNLVWDRLLGLNLFSREVATRELAYYRKIQQKYGLALDNRQPYTKLDWITWSATLTESKEDFAALLAPVVAFLEDTPQRVPVSDWYWVADAKWRGFQARSVVGGVFLKMLYV